MQPLKIHFLIFSLSIISAAQASAQSNVDLEPPMQADTYSQQVLMSPDPSALPVFKFATAEIKEGEVIVSTTVAEQKLIAQMYGKEPVPAELDPKGIRYTENVTQQYTVQVPYVEKIGGKAVQKMRTEIKTRMVPVHRYKKRNAEQQAEFEKAVAAKKKKDAEEGAAEKPKIEYAKMKLITRPYTISVPYTEIVDGKPVTRMRKETRTRTVQVQRGKTETVGKTISSTYKIADVTAYSVAGEKLDEAKIKERLLDRAPVILVNSAQGISPYFETILKPETIFLVCPDSQTEIDPR